jgi:hypothetical protein
MNAAKETRTLLSVLRLTPERALEKQSSWLLTKSLKPVSGRK